VKCPNNPQALKGRHKINREPAEFFFAAKGRKERKEDQPDLGRGMFGRGMGPKKSNAETRRPERGYPRHPRHLRFQLLLLD
jgi:hypothetical protein